MHEGTTASRWRCRFEWIADLGDDDGAVPVPVCGQALPPATGQAPGGGGDAGVEEVERRRLVAGPRGALRARSPVRRRRAPSAVVGAGMMVS